MHEPADASIVNSAAHCTGRIKEAFKNIPVDKQAHCKQFFDLFLSTEEQLNNFATQCWTLFYHPYFKCSGEMQYPAPCNYEIRIPIDQSNPGAISYIVLPAGSKTGDSVVAFYHFMPGPAVLDSPILEPLKNFARYAKKMKSLDDSFGVKLPPNKVAELSDLIAAKGVKFQGLGGANATIRYQVVRITDEPCIRLPCYNLALQCAHQIAYEHIGLMTHKTPDIWAHMEENKLSEFTLCRKSPDDQVLQAMVYWSFFEVHEFSPKERMLWVLTVLRSKEKQGLGNQYESLYKRVTRYFESHLSRATSPR